jgi:hypothetical protein
MRAGEIQNAEQRADRDDVKTTVGSNLACSLKRFDGSARACAAHSTRAFPTRQRARLRRRDLRRPPRHSCASVSSARCRARTASRSKPYGALAKHQFLTHRAKASECAGKLNPVGLENLYNYAGSVVAQHVHARLYLRPTGHRPWCRDRAESVRTRMRVLLHQMVSGFWPSKAGFRGVAQYRLGVWVGGICWRILAWRSA